MEQCRQGKSAKWIRNFGKRIGSEGWAQGPSPEPVGCEMDWEWSFRGPSPSVEQATQNWYKDLSAKNLFPKPRHLMFCVRAKTLGLQSKSDACPLPVVVSRMTEANCSICPHGTAVAAPKGTWPLPVRKETTRPSLGERSLPRARVPCDCAWLARKRAIADHPIR
ncbi:hypothetical protein CISIN_1g045002mg [Citrus sinensis]|uniref:Uncharacterized protein n=1 Tax=Citrus sinensis TaxID=2711 RepID=A0A067DKW5_CITSI|nr:hypothetical protein CISIN_1g045002mg [Citrus sinensis]